MESMSPVPIQVVQPTTTSSNSDRSRRKRKKKSFVSSPSPSQSLQEWRSEKQQQIYSTKLVSALRELRISQPSSSSIPRGGQAVREVADRTLAVTARGKTLWSRAILSKAVKLKFRKHKRQRISNPATTSPLTTGIIRSKKQRATVLRLKAKGLPAVQRKVKLLSRLVPGCRKQAIPVVLEETTDYIAAMEMQIRAMTAILSAVSSPPPGHDGGQTHMLVECRNGNHRRACLSLTTLIRTWLTFPVGPHVCSHIIYYLFNSYIYSTISIFSVNCEIQIKILVSINSDNS